MVAREMIPLQSRLLRHLLIGLGAIIMIYPLVWMMTASFKPETEIFSNPSLLPSDVTLEHYVNGWTALPRGFHVYYFNSVLVAGLAVIGNMFSCSLAAYAFARIRFTGRSFFFAIMMATIMLPIHVVVIPQYILFGSLGWLNTFLPLVVPKFLAVDAFFIFLMVQFIRGLPYEIDEAATIDGCGYFGVYWYVILPLLKPALATTAIFTFIWSWNDFLLPLLFITNSDLYTVPIALKSFVDSTGTSAWGQLLAMSVLALIPIFAIFVMFQRYLTEGISTTGVK